MSQALRKLTGVVSKSKTTLIFINQLREKIGVMFGNPETTTGGRALKFYASVRVDIRRIASIKDGDHVIGGRTRVKIVKNKLAPPFREAEFDIMYGEGVSREGDLLDLAVDKRIIEKSGAWFAYAGERLGQGRENAKQFLKENPDIGARLEKELGGGTGETAFDLTEAAQEGAPLASNPVGPGIAGGDLGVGELAQDIPLKPRVDVAQESHLHLPQRGGEQRMEVSKNPQIQELGGGLMMLVVPAPPPEGLPWNSDQARTVDPTAGKEARVTGRKVGSHHPHHLNPHPKPGGQRRVGGRAPQDVVRLA